MKRPAVAREELWAAQLLEDNPVLYDKITAAIGCRRDEVAAALREVLRFLSLVAAHQEGQLTPAHPVDLAWHEFILCTRAYQQFCDSHFGRMIHHYPGGSANKHRRQFQQTLRQYERRFGAVDARFWQGERAEMIECGACETV